MTINNIKDKLPITDWNSYYVVADFDRTITKSKSITSWSILASSNKVPSTYVEERKALYNKYRPIEIDETMELTKKNKLIKEWFKKHIELFIKYQLTEDLFIDAANDVNIMQFRDGAKDFIDFLHDNNIPLIIISAGIGNFIEMFLTNNDCYYDNIYVSSNKIIFKDGIASGVDQNIIHSLNKNEVSLPDDIKDKLKNRPNVLLLGDQKADLNMVNKSIHDTVITTCFIGEETKDIKDEYAKYFDIILDQKEDYYTLMNLLNKK